MAKNITPILKINLFYRGTEPWFGSLSDEGASWYSNLANESKYGTPSYRTTDSAFGVPAYAPTVEYIGQDRMRTPDRQNKLNFPIGLVLRPFINPKDIGNWVTLPGDNGDWEVIRTFRSPAVDRLTQNNPGVNAAGTTLVAPWGSASSYLHPANPHFAFSMLPLSVTPEYDPTVGGIPYTQIGWSSGKWAIRFFAHGSPILMRLGIPVMELAQPAKYGRGEETEEFVGIVRYQRGCLMISLDDGATYDVYYEPDGSPVECPTGTYQFTGQGCAATLGLHQVVYEAGTYTSPTNPMDRYRGSLANPVTVDADGTLYGTSTVSWTSIAPLNTNYMQYRLDLGPGTEPAYHWAYYRSPEVYVVKVRYPTFSSFWASLHDNGATFEGRVLRAEIEKPVELDGGTATWTCRYTTQEGGPIIDWQLRRVEIYGGNEFDDGTNNVGILFAGYIVDADVTYQGPNEVRVTYTAQSTALRPKRMKWRASTLRAFDGMTVNEALAAWCYDMGLDSRFYIPHTLGNIAIPQVLIEEPAYMPSSGDERWDIMDRIVHYAGMELGVTNNGSYRIVPRNTWEMTAYTWDGAPTSDNQGYIEELNYQLNSCEGYSGVEIQSKDVFGNFISAWIQDYSATQNTLSSRFRPWPDWHIETVEGPVDKAWLAYSIRGLAYDKLVEKPIAQWKGPLAHFVSRRDAVRILNTKVGMTNAAWVGVLAMRHIFDRTEGDEAWTELTGVRLA